MVISMLMFRERSIIPSGKGYEISGRKFGQCHCLSPGLKAEEQTDVPSRSLSVLFFKD